MDKSCSIVLPNQLFKESLFQKKNFKVFLVEENLFFNQYKFHKQKICFHRATMKFYYDYLNDFGCNTEYIDSFSKESNIKLLIKKINNLGYKIIEIYDPVDYLLCKRLKSTCTELKIKLVIHESKLFINTSEELKDFFKESKKKFFQTSFYKSERKKRNILIDDKGKPLGGEWTYDILNRKKFPKNEIPPKIVNPARNKYVIDSEKYVTKYFNENYGSLGQFNYPTTIKESENWFRNFLKERFKKFGETTAGTPLQYYCHNGGRGKLVELGQGAFGIVYKGSFDAATSVTLAAGQAKRFNDEIPHACMEQQDGWFVVNMRFTSVGFLGADNGLFHFTMGDRIKPIKVPDNVVPTEIDYRSKKYILKIIESNLNQLLNINYNKIRT